MSDERDRIVIHTLAELAAMAVIVLLALILWRVW